MKTAPLAHAYRITDGRQFRLADHDPAHTAGFTSKEEGAKALAPLLARLDELQERLYAENQRSVLLVLQAMDAAGKDSAIEHVMSGLNPQGCEVHSFKSPSDEELDHDFLWRCALRLPRRGRIGIFNRSYYEETLVVRVHPELLDRQKLPADCRGRKIWEERHEDIRHFEQHLARNGTTVLKFFLHVSREEQRRRFLARLDDPAKHWKFAAGDLAERARWGDYMAAYEETIRATACAVAPWYVVPADHKWFTRLVIADAFVTQLEALAPQFPQLPANAKRQLQRARATLKKSAV